MYAREPFSRRRFLQTGLGLLTLSAALPLRRALADAAPQNAISSDAALRRLMDGNARYAANKIDPKDFSAGRAEAVKAGRMRVVGAEYELASGKVRLLQGV